MKRIPKNPGVYINEVNAFPISVVAVETALPVFIGYTEKAGSNGESLIGVPTRVDSLQEYRQFFGEGYHHQFTLTDTSHQIQNFTPALLQSPDTIFYLYNCLRLSYANGLGRCYILSLGTYGNGPNKKTSIDIADFPDAVFDELAKVPQITMVIIPDFVNNRHVCYDLYRKVLQHCSATQSRMGIFDVIPGADDADNTDTFNAFRTGIGTEALSYGAAYYPWLHTDIVQPGEINFTNLAFPADDLKVILPEEKVAQIIDRWQAAKAVAGDAATQNEVIINEQNKSLHEALLGWSPTYVQLMGEIRKRLNLLPPAAAMAGIWCRVDNTRGVWKAPANVSLSLVKAPAVNISREEQQTMNVDVVTGKSINAIRAFPGQGTLVWGCQNA